jgi:hypothetical protein
MIHLTAFYDHKSAGGRGVAVVHALCPKKARSRCVPFEKSKTGHKASASESLFVIKLGDHHNSARYKIPGGFYRNQKGINTYR